jgi:peptide deformylase
VKVVRAPDPVLSQIAKKVDPLDPRVIGLAEQMVTIMRASPGCVGLAAPQVGISAQLFVADVTGHPKAVTVHGLIVLANAELAEASRWKSGREGCLSVPDLTGDVWRASRVVVTGDVPATGERLTITTDAFEARALQHEIDHCNGLLFLDRVSSAHGVYRRQVYR